MTTYAPDLVSGTWRAAAEATQEVARRLADVEHVRAIASVETNRDPIVGELQWHPGVLSHGYPGTAMLFGVLHERHGGWAEVAHAHISEAAAHMDVTPARGITSGPAALLTAVLTRPDAYATLRTRLTEWVATNQLTELAAAERRITDGGRGARWGEYDAITGVSGVGRILLDALEVTNAERTRQALEATCRWLTGLAKPVDTPRGPAPGWWVPPEHEPVEQDRAVYPEGDLNLGMAHGVAGPLAFLCESHRRGVEVPGQADAIRAMANWVVGWRLDDQGGAYPCRVPLEEETDRSPRHEHLTRAAWCYGAGGIALALAQAGAALKCDDLLVAAADTLRSALGQDPAEQRLDGPTICHGHAGLLLSVHEVARLTGDAALRAGIPALVDAVLRDASPEAPFLFQHEAPDSPDGWRKATRTRRMDVAGVLEGAAGVALVLDDVLVSDNEVRSGFYWGGALMCPR